MACKVKRYLSYNVFLCGVAPLAAIAFHLVRDGTRKNASWTNGELHRVHLFLFAVPAIKIGLQAGSSIWQLPAPRHDDHPDKIQGRDNHRPHHYRLEVAA